MPKTNRPVEQTEQQVQIIAVDTEPSMYANNVEIKLSAWDVRFWFGEIQNVNPEAKEIMVTRRVRVIMSPQHAKAFSKVLADNIQKYEDAFGELQVEPNAGVPTQ